jgi:hypothetical protein
MVQAVPVQNEYLRTARKLASAHRVADPETRLIFLSPDDTEQEIFLLEVSGSTPTTRELYPFAFDARPDLDILFPSVVLLLSQTEWDEVSCGQLALPPGWDRARLIDISPP